MYEAGYDGAGREIAKYLRDRRPDVIFVSHMHLARFVPEDMAAAVGVLDTHNVEWRRVRRLAMESLRRGNLILAAAYAQQAFATRYFESQLIRRFRETWAVSELDRDEFCKLANGDVRIVENGHSVSSEYSWDRSGSIGSQPILAFAGSMSYSANADAVSWMLREWLPRGEFSLSLYGLGSERFGHSGQPRVTGHGFVGNLESELLRADAFFAPLRVGAGTKLKVVQAMALGLPVIATDIAMEGLRAEAGVHFIRVSGPADMQLALDELRTNASRISESASELVRERSWRSLLTPHVARLAVRAGHGGSL